MTDKVEYYFENYSYAKQELKVLEFQLENYKPIIVNLENLAEDSRTNDYMDWSNEIANYKMKLESLPFS